jgi:hypothetical protein
MLGHGARAAEEGIEPPTTMVNGHPLFPLSYSALRGAEHWVGPRTATGYRPPASGLRTRRTAFIRWRPGDAGRFRSDNLRGESPACSRCTTAPERKVEVSNPHGRTVSLFSKQGAPSQRGIPSVAEGQRIERWRGCPRPSLSKRAPFLSVNPPMSASPPLSRPCPRLDRTSILRWRRPSRVQSRHGGGGTEAGPEPPPGTDPGTSAVPGLRSSN